MKGFSFWGEYSFVKSSVVRKGILNLLLEHERSPSEISENLNCHLSHVSRALTELLDKNLIECLTPKRTKSKMYAITVKGKSVLSKILENEK